MESATFILPTNRKRLLFFCICTIICIILWRLAIWMTEKGMGGPLNHRTNPIIGVIGGLIGIVGCSQKYVLYEKYLAIRFLGIPIRKIYWVEFNGGVLVRKTGAKKAEIVFTFLGHDKFDPQANTALNFCKKHLMGTVYITVPWEQQELCARKIRKYYPDFYVYDAN